MLLKCGATGTLIIHCREECKMVQATLEDSFAVSYKTEPIIQLINYILWYLLNEMKTYIHTKTCTRVFIVALLVSAKRGSN